MEARERYIVCLTNGTTVNVLAYTFGEVIEKFSEDEVWQITRLAFDEIEEAAE